MLAERLLCKNIIFNILIQMNCLLTSPSIALFWFVCSYLTVDKCTSKQISNNLSSFSCCSSYCTYLVATASQHQCSYWTWWFHGDGQEAVFFHLWLGVQRLVRGHTPIKKPGVKPPTLGFAHDCPTLSVKVSQGGDKNNDLPGWCYSSRPLAAELCPWKTIKELFEAAKLKRQWPLQWVLFKNGGL